MELNSRCVQILTEILAENKAVMSARLVEKLGITRRAMYYDLTKINSWLDYYGLGYVEMADKMLILHSEDFAAISQKLKDFETYQFSVTERRALVLLYIALCHKPVTLEDLQRFFDVSKNTILNDIKDWKTQLLAYDIKIDILPRKGYCLGGEEFGIRKVLGTCIYKLENQFPKDILYTLLQNSLASLTGCESIDFRSLVKHAVKEYEKSINTYLVLSDMDYEIIMIMVTCVRSLLGYTCTLEKLEQHALKNTHEYSMVLLIIQTLYDAKIVLPLDETYYITVLFLGIKNFDFSSAAAENHYIQHYAVELVKNFERIACVSFEDKPTFLSRLYQHIRPMYYRLKYGIRTTSSLIDQIRSMYMPIYRYTKLAAKKVGGEIYSLITEEELSYLCIYMVSYLGESTSASVVKRKKILIICGAGVAASVLLREQLTELLGDAFFYHMVPAPKVAGEDLSSYYMVVTTVPMEKSGTNVILTGPILNEDSKQKILSLISESSAFAFASVEAREILDIVRKHGSVDEERVYPELLQYFILRKNNHIVIQPCPKLKDLLAHKNTVKVINASSMSELVLSACQSVGYSKASVKKYTGEVMARIEDTKELLEIVPGAALEYCLSVDSSGETGLSIVISGSGVDFKKSTVNILVLLRTVNNSNHYPLLDEIYEYFSDKQFVRTLISKSKTGHNIQSYLLKRNLNEEES